MQFNYKSYTHDGVQKNGAIEAPNMSEASLMLSSQGLIVFDLRRNGNDLWARLHEPRGAQHEFSRKDVQSFLGDLGQLVGAGIRLDAALKLATEMTEKPGAQKVIRKIREDLRSGASFSNACASHPKAFTPHMIAAFQAAEKTGQLEQALTRLSESEAQILKFREQLSSNLVYPALLFSMVVLTFILVVFVVLPEFTPLFDVAGTDIPAMTRGVIAFSDFMHAYGASLLVIMFLCVALIISMFTNSASRAQAHKALLEVEALRNWFIPPDLIRASQILGSSLSVGVRIDVALNLTADSIKNEWLKGVFVEAANAVRKGERLGSFLAEKPIIPPLFVHFVRIGEETGDMGKMCLEVTKHMTRAYQKKLDRLLAILPPVVTLVLGGMIAVLVGSILLGMISLNNAIL